MKIFQSATKRSRSLYCLILAFLALYTPSSPGYGDTRGSFSAGRGRVQIQTKSGGNVTVALPSLQRIFGFHRENSQLIPYPQEVTKGEIAGTPILDKVDWNKAVLMPPNAASRLLKHSDDEGFQVGKFATENLPFWENQEALQLTKPGNLLHRVFTVGSDVHALIYSALVARSNHPKGIIIDCGAGVFKSTNILAAINAGNVVYGLDTFSGLPASWKRKDADVFPSGTFAPTGQRNQDRIDHNQPPFPIADNVVLIAGNFSDTMPHLAQCLKKSENSPIALINVDCDLYESCRDALEPLLPLIQEGTVIHFDEFYNYSGFENGEFLIYQELVAMGFKLRPIVMNGLHQQVAFVVTAVPVGGNGLHFPAKN